MPIQSGRFVFMLGLSVGLAVPALAQSERYSTNIYGALGLNTVPTARMDPQGTVRAQIGTLDPYIHGSLGFQIAEPLYINLRQTAEVSDINGDADRLYPGIDFKLRLMEERPHTPAVSIGAVSAVGHTRMAGEYLALSKRYKDFDFTAGLGWGRFAGSAQFNNPLGVFSSHFDDPRAIDGEDPNTIEDWFTGEKVGTFAGVEYFTPIKGLSLKADYGGDRFEAEQAAFDFEAPAPWSVGLNYKPRPFVDIGLAAQGTDKIMARLSLQGMIQNLPSPATKDPPKTAMRAYRTGIAVPAQMKLRAERDNITLTQLETDITHARANLTLSRHHAAPHQIGQAAIHMANHAGPAIEEIAIHPVMLGLRGPSVHLMRRSLEGALGRNQGSAEEIWAATEIAHNFAGLQQVQRIEGHPFDPKNVAITLENHVSLAEEDEGFLGRSSLIIETQQPHRFPYFLAGTGLRLNLADNLDSLNDLRAPVPLPVRSDVDEFAERRIALDTAYIALPHTILPDLHSVVTAGYLEEMYAGAGGEILYRPFDKRFALGAESWLALKRDPDTLLNATPTGDHLLTAHVNAYYDLPHWDVTAGIKAGRFLAEDLGTTFSLNKNFKNGARLEGFVTLSDQSDFDIFGGTTNADHGIRLTLPLGGLSKHLQNTRIKLITSPLGRDIGQSIQSPLPLYELTEPFSKAHLLKHWDEITP